VSWTLTKRLDASAGPGEITEEEGGGAKPTSQPRRDQELGLSVGLLSLQLFPNSGATDIVFVTLFCIAAGTATAWCGRCAMLGGHCFNVLLFWRRSTAALVFRVGACLEVFPTRPRP